MQNQSALLCGDRALNCKHVTLDHNNSHVRLRHVWHRGFTPRCETNDLNLTHCHQRFWQRHANAGERQLIVETKEDLVDAIEVQDNYSEALETAVKFLCNSVLTAGIAFELFGAWQYRQQVTAAYTSCAHLSDLQDGSSRLVSASLDVPRPSIALKQYALVRMGIWALLLLALGQKALAWVRNCRRFNEPHVLHDGKLIADHLSVELQGRALREVRQQVSGLQLRARISSRDFKTQLRQVQQDSKRHAEATSALAADAADHLERLEDNESLLAALQVVSSKQFAVLLKALPHLSSRPGAPPGPIPPSAGQALPLTAGQSSSDGAALETALPAASAFHSNYSIGGLNIVD